MIGLILILHWRVQPTLDEWKRFIVGGLIFVIPYEIINALGINLFRLWQNNADSPLPTLCGSPIETIPFAFLGAILSLLFLKFFKSWRGKCILWLILAFFASLQAYISTLFGFLTWLNWNFFASFILWIFFIGIVIGIDFIIQKYIYKK